MLVSAGVLAAFGLIYVVGRSPRRALPDNVVEQMKALPERRPNQRVVDLELADGRIIRKVYVAYDRYPAVIGGTMILGHYRPADVVCATQHQ